MNTSNSITNESRAPYAMKETFTSVEDFLDDLVKFERSHNDVSDFTQEEKNFLIKEIEKYNNQWEMSVEDLLQFLKDLVSQNFEEKRVDIISRLMAMRLFSAINEKRIQSIQSDTRERVNNNL